MKGNRLLVWATTALLSAAAGSSHAADNVRLRLFFGLSKPAGGVVTESEWASFEKQVIATQFEGFNVVDSTGFYRGNPEPSKVVTLLLTESEIPKARKVAATYAKQFGQDSVMLVSIPVDSWEFIGADTNSGPAVQSGFLDVAGSADDQEKFIAIWNACEAQSPGFEQFAVKVRSARNTIPITVERGSAIAPASTKALSGIPRLVFDLADLENFPVAAGQGSIPDWATTRCLVIAHEVAEWDLYEQGYRLLGDGNTPTFEEFETLSALYNAAHIAGIGVENKLRKAAGAKHFRSIASGSPQSGTLCIRIGPYVEVSDWSHDENGSGPDLVAGSIAYREDATGCS